MCGVQRGQLVSLFQKFGSIERILMFPGRSFSFLSFEYVNESMKAIKAVHGRVLDCPSEFPRPEVTFYLSFLASVPDEVSIENQAKPSGLVLVEDFVSDAEEEELIKALGWGSDSCDNEYQGTGISLQCTASQWFHLVMNSVPPSHPPPHHKFGPELYCELHLRYCVPHMYVSFVCTLLNVFTINLECLG